MIYSSDAKVPILTIYVTNGKSRAHDLSRYRPSERLTYKIARWHGICIFLLMDKAIDIFLIPGMGLITALIVWRVKRLADACCADVEYFSKLNPKAYGLQERNR